jgi:hypothetical protein
VSVATRRRFLTFAASAGLLALARPVHAAPGLRAELVVDREKLRVGEELQMELVVTRTGSGSVPDPSLPTALADAFEVVSQFSSTSASTRFGTGGASRSVSVTVSIGAVALRPGKHELVFTTDDGGTEVKSNAVTVVVEGEALKSEETAVATTGKPTESLGEVFLWASTDKSKAYVGEQISYALDVYERRQLISVTLRTPPSFPDFHTYDLPEGETTVEVVQGMVHRVRPGMRRALFPQKAGTLTIGAAEIAIGRRRRGKSPTLAIEVLPLPAEGQPKGFAATNVGQFELTAEVDKTNAEVGKPFTWTVTLSGTGNLSLVDPGKWPELKGARRYDPKIETDMRAVAVVGGTKTWSFLVIPEQPGTLVVPAHVLHYFDPQLGRYATTETQAVEVQVDGTAIASSNEPIEASADDRERFAPFVTDATVPRDRVRDRWLTPRRWLWGMLAVPAIAGSVWVGGTAWARLGPDELRRREAAERQRQRQRIDAARQAIENGDGFHGQLATLLHDQAVLATDGEGVGLARPELLRMLARRAVVADDVRRLEALLDACDAGRFAAQRGTAAERHALFDEAVALLRESTLARRRS